MEDIACFLVLILRNFVIRRSLCCRDSSCGYYFEYLEEICLAPHKSSPDFGDFSYRCLLFSFLFLMKLFFLFLFFIFFIYFSVLLFSLNLASFFCCFPFSFSYFFSVSPCNSEQHRFPFPVGFLFPFHACYSDSLLPSLFCYFFSSFSCLSSFCTVYYLFTIFIFFTFVFLLF